MDVDKLRTFLEVISTENFFQASINLNVTQSTVSARIRALEERLGQRLFERHASGVTLTDAGRHLQNECPVFETEDQGCMRLPPVPYMPLDS